MHIALTTRNQKQRAFLLVTNRDICINIFVHAHIKGCQERVARIQEDLDRAVQNFGMAMQQGMMNCQNQAQKAMEGGVTEAGIGTIFYILNDKNICAAVFGKFIFII